MDGQEVPLLSRREVARCRSGTHGKLIISHLSARRLGCSIVFIQDKVGPPVALPARMVDVDQLGATFNTQAFDITLKSRP